MLLFNGVSGIGKREIVVVRIFQVVVHRNLNILSAIFDGIVKQVVEDRYEQGAIGF